MKPRKWVIVVATCCALLVSAYYWSISVIEKNGHIERLLVQTISSSTGNALSVDKITFGFLSVYLHNVSMTVGTDFFRLNVHDLKIGFSLKKLVRFKGNVGRSINKMILIRPEADVVFVPLPAHPPIDQSLAVKSFDIFSTLSNLPVDQFYIREGTVRLVDGKREEYAVTEQLSGNVKAQSAGVSFDLHGAVAGGRKNLSVSGFVSKNSRHMRISARLDRAHIQKPFRLQPFELRTGILDGVCELSLPYPLSPTTMESAGWIRLRDATAFVDGFSEPLTSLTLAITLQNTSCRIDSVKGSWRGISCKGSGLWNMAAADDCASAIALQCQGIRPELFMRKPARSALPALRGNGWFVARLSKRRLSAAHTLTLTAGGISIFGVSVLASVKARLEARQLSIDTCAIWGASITAGASGIINWARAPVAYTCTCYVKADSLLQLPELRGSGPVRLRGTLHGLGAKPRFKATIEASALRCREMALGNMEIAVTGDGFDRIQFDCSQGTSAWIRASGSIDDCLRATPYMKALFSVGPQAIRSIMSQTAAAIAPAVDSSRISGMFSGSAEEFELSGQTLLYTSAVHGTALYRVVKSKKNKTVAFNLCSSGLYAGDSALPFAASGVFRDSILRIDSLSALGSVRGSGYVRTSAHTGTALEFFLASHNLSLPALNTWIFKRKLPLKNGSVAGNSRIYGSHGRISTESQFALRGCSVDHIDGLEADVVVKSRDAVVTMLPMMIKKDGLPFITLDTLNTTGKRFRFSGKFDSVALKTVLAGVVSDEYVSGENELQGALSGCFHSEKSGLPIHVQVSCPAVTMNCWRCDSLRADVDIVNHGIVVKQLSLSDGNRMSVACDGYIPWTATAARGDSAFAGDTLEVRCTASGDLLSSFERNISRPFHVPVAGSGMGTVSVEFKAAGGPVRLYKMQGGIPRGTLRVKPYVLQDIKDFSCMISMEQPDFAAGDSLSEPSPKVTIVINGSIDKRPIRIATSHTIPRGLEPLRLGFVDAGVIEVNTPHHGVNLHLPGLMEPGVTADIEFAPKSPFPAFILSGPVDRIKFSGTWILHGGEFTFPPMKNDETVSMEDLFPYITWNLDVKPVNRKLKYFYDTGTKNRRLMRLVECYLDPASTLSLRGRDMDHSFKVLGALRSYKGSVFFRRVFDQNFEVGLDFAPQPLVSGDGFDNRPIIWGSAEGTSEKNRLDKIKLTLFTRDSVTGALSERGRFYDVRFRVSSDVEEVPGESEIEFLKTEGKRVASVEGAGELVSSLGEQYVHRFLLQNLQDRLAQSLGLDVINFETSIASNYFNKLYNRQLVNLANDWSYLAFANVGITFGRYILYDKVFLKWRTELVPVDTLIKPEYTMGFELQPLNYFMMDFDYGVRPGQKSLEQDPKIYLQLRLPIETMRKYFNF